ncbi:MAG: hypothetical protein MUO76_08665, partial [Anaerolineaceae bacterium]|nr:hypothetical protein [Anaerolineaceae bacterium]
MIHAAVLWRYRKLHPDERRRLDLLLSARYLKGDAPLILPSITLAAAITFHLMAGFLLPSLAYLYYLELKKKRIVAILASIIISAAIVAVTIWFFDYTNILPLSLFIKSHAFGAVNGPDWYLSKPSL